MPIDIDLEKKIGQWAEDTFRQSTLLSIFNHAKRELTELETAIANYNEMKDKQLALENIREEMADITLLMLHASYKLSFSLSEAVEDKFKVIQDREWNEPDDEGVCEHVK